MLSGNKTQRNGKEQNEYQIFVRVKHEEEEKNKIIPHCRNSSNIDNSQKESNWILLQHKYITAHFPALVQARQ